MAARRKKPTPAQQALAERRLRTVKGVVYETRTEAVLQRMRQTAVDRVTQGLKDLRDTMIASIEASSNGTYYPEDNKWTFLSRKMRDLSPHWSSAKRQAPNSLSGDLVRSIKYKVYAKDAVGRQRPKDGWTDTIVNDVLEVPAWRYKRTEGQITGTIWVEGRGMGLRYGYEDPAYYAMALEFGFTKAQGKKIGGPIAPRPFFRPAFAARKEFMKQRLRLPWNLTSPRGASTPSRTYRGIGRVSRYEIDHPLTNISEWKMNQ